MTAVSAIIVTRGNVDLLPVLDSLPQEWERLVWQNGKSLLTYSPGEAAFWPMEHLPAHGGYWPDLSVYGRYAAIEYASHDLIYVQDDDVIVSGPSKLVEEWQRVAWQGTARFGQAWSGMVCNQPQEFRHSFYEDHSLVGFGACFDRAVPERAFRQFDGTQIRRAWNEDDALAFFHRTCDIIVTCLTPRVLVDVPKTDLPYATDETRMYRQRDHVGERTRMLELARMVRDA